MHSSFLYESYLVCPHPPSSYEGRREQGRKLSFWWKTLNLIGHYGNTFINWALHWAAWKSIHVRDSNEWIKKDTHAEIGCMGFKCLPIIKTKLTRTCNWKKLCKKCTIQKFDIKSFLKGSTSKSIKFYSQWGFFFCNESAIKYLFVHFLQHPNGSL